MFRIDSANNFLGEIFKFFILKSCQIRNIQFNSVGFHLDKFNRYRAASLAKGDTLTIFLYQTHKEIMKVILLTADFEFLRM